MSTDGTEILGLHSTEMSRSCFSSSRCLMQLWKLNSCKSRVVHFLMPFESWVVLKVCEVPHFFLIRSQDNPALFEMTINIQNSIQKIFSIIDPYLQWLAMVALKSRRDHDSKLTFDSERKQWRCQTREVKSKIKCAAYDLHSKMLETGSSETGWRLAAVNPALWWL